MRRAAQLRGTVLFVAGAFIVAVVLGAGTFVLLRDDPSGGSVEAGGDGSTTTTAPTPTTTTAPVPAYQSTVATAKVPQVIVIDGPDPATATIVTVFDNPVVKVDADGNTYEVPLVFLVEEQSGDFVNVLLPIRPNGSTGWIRATDVDLTPNNFKVTVELTAHQITVTDADNIVLQEAVGVGVGNTPTPGGRYYIKELLQTPDPDGAYGPYAYGLSGFSDVLTEFNGGPGDIGIHGTNDPGAIGTDVSNGCIRMSNEGITTLAGMLPLGTPVEIIA